MSSIINATTTNGVVIQPDNSGSLVLQTNSGTTALTIDTSQRVGIGTTSPASKLDVVGSSTGTVQQFIKNSNGATNSSADIVFGNWSGSTPSAPQAKVSAINIASSDARTDLVFSTYTGLVLNEGARIDSSQNFKFNSGYGSVATAYGCRAWVNFNGTGTPAIRASGNVSSITDNGTGDYTINFTNAFVDANYAVTSTGSNGNADGIIPWIANAQTTPTTSAVRIRYGNFDGTLNDASFQSVAVFR